jgi:signal transduction histidine kinase
MRKIASEVWLLVSAGAVLAGAEWPLAMAAQSGNATGLTLSNAAQVLQLSPEQASGKPPVRIQGVVTCYDHGRVLFVQDTTGGVFVYHRGDRLPLRAGQYVRVTGFAKRGRYSHYIDLPAIQPVESGPVINPRAVSLAQVHYGGFDAQWTELKGVVRSQKIFDDRLLLELMDPPHRVLVWVTDYEGYERLSLAGSLVRVRGVVGSLVRDQGRLEGFQVFANAIGDLAILQPPLGDPFSAPLRPVQDLASHHVRNGDLSRMRVRGVVTHCQPGRAVFIQDATGGLEVRPQSLPNDLIPGAVVDVSGYPGPILESPLLEDALIRKLETNAAPQPVRLSSGELFQGRYNNQLVEVEAQFLGRANAPSNRLALALQVGNRLLTALLDTPDAPVTLKELSPGGKLRLTGVWHPRASLGDDSAVSLLLRSPMDVKVISSPAPSRRFRLSTLAAATILTGAGLLVALLLLQKQRSETRHVLQLQADLQAETRQSELQLRRSMEERERIGRDLHDDIIQSIYAAGLSLEDCRRMVRQLPEQAEARLVAAIHTLNNTINSVRGFIAGLEPKVLNGRELKTALKSLALTSGDSPTQFQFQVDTAAANSLTSAQATQLLHIAKEAMSNSLRHAHASGVTVSLQPLGNGARLEIADDGVGFDPGAAGRTGQGLRNMAARAREIGGDLQTISSPGRGCRMLVTVPQRNSNEPH